MSSTLGKAPEQQKGARLNFPSQDINVVGRAGGNNSDTCRYVTLTGAQVLQLN